MECGEPTELVMVKEEGMRVLVVLVTAILGLLGLELGDEEGGR